MRVHSLVPAYEGDKYVFSYKPFGCLSLTHIDVYTIQYDNLYNPNIAFQLEFFRDLTIHPHNATHRISSFAFPPSYGPLPNPSSIIKDKSLGIKCFWNNDLNTKDLDQYRISVDYTTLMKIDKSKTLSKSGYVYGIKPNETMAGVLTFLRARNPDEFWSNQDKPDPSVIPQSHISNMRSWWYAKNLGFTLYGYSWVNSKQVFLLENGMFFDVDSQDSLFLQANDIDLQYNLNLGDDADTGQNLKKLQEYIIRPIVIPEKDLTPEFFNTTKTSQWKFKMKLNLFIYKNVTAYRNRRIQIIEIPDDELSNMFISTRQVPYNMLINNNPINLNGKDLLDKKLIEQLVIKDFCTLYKLKPNPYFAEYYVTCSLLKGNSNNYNFIRNQILSSLINIQLDLDDVKNNLVGSFYLFNQLLTGRFMENNAVCLGVLRRTSIMETVLFKVDSHHHTEVPIVTEENFEYAIELKKLSNLQISMTAIFKSEKDGKDDIDEKDIKGIMVLIPYTLTIIKFDLNDILSKTPKIVEFRDITIIGKNLIVWTYTSQFNSTIDLLGFYELYSKPAPEGLKMFSCSIMEKKFVNNRFIVEFFDEVNWSKNNNNPLIIGVAVGGGVVVIFSIIITILCVRRCKRKRKGMGSITNVSYDKVGLSHVSSFKSNSSSIDMKKIDVNVVII